MSTSASKKRDRATENSLTWIHRIHRIKIFIPFILYIHVHFDMKWEGKMESLKQEAVNAISKMNDSAEIDDIMYRLYVIDKVRKGKEAVERGDTVSTEELRKEIETW